MTTGSSRTIVKPRIEIFGGPRVLLRHLEQRDRRDQRVVVAERERDATPRDACPAPLAGPGRAATWKPMKRVASAVAHFDQIVRPGGTSSKVSACAFHLRRRSDRRGSATPLSSDGSAVPGCVSTSHTSRTSRGSLDAVRPRRVALRVRGPVLIANRLAVDLQADERARQLGVELGGELRGRGAQRALHALAFGRAQLAEPLVLHPRQRRHEQHHEPDQDRDRRHAALAEPSRSGFRSPWEESSTLKIAINPAKSTI